MGRGGSSRRFTSARESKPAKHSKPSRRMTPTQSVRDKFSDDSAIRFYSTPVARPIIRHCPGLFKTRGSRRGGFGLEPFVVVFLAYHGEIAAGHRRMPRP